MADRIGHQRDFSAGMFRNVDPLLIPANGAYDIVGLLEDGGGVMGRGGSSYISNGMTPTSGVDPGVWWFGTVALASGEISIAAISPGYDVFKVTGGGTVTLLGTLTEASRPVVYAGKLWWGDGQSYVSGAGLTAWARPSPASFPHFLATAANRLFVGYDDKVAFSGFGNSTFAVTDFHQLPGGGHIIGMVGFRDSVLVFTDKGVWRISNVGFNLTDANGNIQHRLDLISRDVILWHDLGLATFEGGLVVCARDGIYVMRIGVQGEVVAPFELISGPINPVYRAAARSNVVPSTTGEPLVVVGLPDVYRGHLFVSLPADFGDSRDLYVCRLDTPGRPWTRLAGSGANVLAVFADRSPGSDQQTLMAGTYYLSATRLMALSYFDPASTPDDADFSDPPWEITTRDYATGALNFNTVSKLRASYELVDPASANPTITASYDVGAPDGSFTALTGAAPENPTGLATFSWKFAKRARSIRFRLSSSNRYSRLILRGLEVFARSSGRV